VRFGVGLPSAVVAYLSRGCGIGRHVLDDSGVDGAREDLEKRGGLGKQA
jgi:hypothetical protein